MNSQTRTRCETLGCIGRHDASVVVGMVGKGQEKGSCCSIEMQTMQLMVSECCKLRIRWGFGGWLHFVESRDFLVTDTTCIRDEESAVHEKRRRVLAVRDNA